MITLMTEMIISFLLLIILFANNDSEAIDCFRCNSFGGANSYCEDPFHNNFSATILQSPCWTGRKGRDGLYPATACIKLSGRFEDNGDTMIVRDCALDSGSLTTDTELVRMSHCGGFYFDNRYVKGCVQSCSENACNRASTIKSILSSNKILQSKLSLPMIIEFLIKFYMIVPLILSRYLILH
ncbi:hypothetical protein SSS_09579 [Sarcoptes scabiei]|nr:hypothetical protein SSS_09579 [Sarcoptes scabiei]